MAELGPISLIIPVFNESKTVAELINTIKEQSFQPTEIIIVDGGSTDNTVYIIKELTNNNKKFRLIEVERGTPGKGRNIGASHAGNKWIAFTDAGIILDRNWLQNLVKKASKDSKIDIVYGNFSPQIKTFFDKCAAISYVPPLKRGQIRTKSIVSCLLRKDVWEQTGGFPDWRATEDLVFMENAEKLNYSIAFAPDAIVYWQLRPNLHSPYSKFELYSKYNVWAGRQAYWHYGIARQYAVMLLAILLAIFHSWYWLLMLPIWMVARVAKRIISHRYQFGLKLLFNPAIFFISAIITLVIDAATFVGWIKAIGTKPETVHTL